MCRESIGAVSECATNQELSLNSCSSKLVPPQLPPLASWRFNRSESRFAFEPRLIRWLLAS